MAGITTSMATSFKLECLGAGHCFNQTATPTGTTTNGQFTVTALSSLTWLSVGNGITGTGIPAGTVIASIDSTTQITLSKAATASGTVTLTSTGDVFKLALVKQTPAGTYDATTTNYSNITGNSDEVTGTGYVVGGVTLTTVAPAASGTTAYVSFNNPSWTTASFTTIGCIIYNSSKRQGTVNRAVAVYDFSGSQTVSAGTFTLLMPTASASTAVIRFQ